jgi:hypothetical protein
LKIEEIGTYFPVKLAWWDKRHKYTGAEIRHLYFVENVFGEKLFGNYTVMWRGPMEVKLENLCDVTERIKFADDKYKIKGPNLIHIVADFPQLGNSLREMYSFQNILADMIVIYLLRNCEKRVQGNESDILIDGKKLNVAICNSNVKACQMHFGVNLTLRGKPSPPMKATCLVDELKDKNEKKIIEDLKEITRNWIMRLNQIQKKVYKTVTH